MEMGEQKYPWQRGILSEWAIVGMNHYRINGERRLFVAMTKGGKCIVEEGQDDEYLWNRLWHKADAELRAPLPPSPTPTEDEK
jgi:hypothetical protein